MPHHPRDLAAMVATMFLLAAASGCGSSSKGGATGTGGGTSATGGATGAGGGDAATGGGTAAGGAAATGGITGAGGDATGAGGDATGAGGAGGAGGGDGFVAVSPCLAENDYVATGSDKIEFGGSDIGFAYSPQCLKVTVGSTVTFQAAGADDFSTHPLVPSAVRGTLNGSPITTTISGSQVAFVFATPGYYAYFCAEHGMDAAGTGMVGVIWVQ